MPIVEENKIGVEIDNTIEIIVDTQEQTITEEINHVPIATQKLSWWRTCFVWIWDKLTSCCSCKKSSSTQSS